jgi:hypothetical protein
MRLLPRPRLEAAILGALLVLIALPVTWTDRAPWHGMTMALCHAAGSPDETLSPSPTPTGKHSAALVRPDDTRSGGSLDAPGGLERMTPGAWDVFLRVTLESLLRL